MTKNSKLSQEMIDERKIASAKQKIASLGLDPEEIMPKLQAKMGTYAADFVTQAMRFPGELCNRTGESFQKSKALISTYANEDISDERIAKALGAKNKKDAEAKAIKVQESAVKYLAKRDLQSLTNKDALDIQQEAALKQLQAASRIDKRAQDQAQTPQKEAVLIPIEKETEKEAVLAPITPEPVAQKTNKLPFSFEPVPQNDFYNSWQKPVQTPEVTPASTTKVATVQPETIEGNGTPMDPLRDKAREELARLKASKEGELSLNELSDAGISPQDMERVYTKDRLAEIHAGPQGQALGKKAKQIDAQRHTVGKCAGAAGDSIRITTGYTYQAETEGVVKYRVGKKTKFSKNNGTTQTRAIRKADEFYAFDFESNKQQGNPEIATLTQPGTYIGWEAQANATQPLGHAAIMGPDGNWHCDITQSPEYMSSTKPAKRYQSDTYTIAFLGDSTASDKLAEDMIYQKLVREERDRQQAEQKNQPVNVAMINAAQNTL